MKRNLIDLADREFDILVVGGGIYGAWAAWDAALRGLEVALIDREDFGSGTSSNNFKLVHGGLRYLQHLDLKRMRESIREQRTLRRVAPHLVHPIPCLVPTYGRGMRGRPALRLALFLNDLVSCDRNRGVPAGTRLPGRRILSGSEVRERVPGVPDAGLTGGALWHDAQMRNPDRLLLAILRSATGRGAVLANYTEAETLLLKAGRVVGARVRDRLAGDSFSIRAKMTLNTTGPWADELLGTLYEGKSPGLCPPTQAWNLVLNRQLIAGTAVGLYGPRRFQDKDRKISRGSRLIFFAPWRGRTLVGTAHLALAAGKQRPDPVGNREEMLDFLDEAAGAYPAAHLSEDDIGFAHCGVLPGTVDPRSGDVCLAKHYRVHQHHREDGIGGIISAVGVKFTTARDVAERLVDLALVEMGGRRAPSHTAATPLFGGEISDWRAFRDNAERSLPEAVPRSYRRTLAENYGTSVADMVAMANGDSELLRPIDEGVSTLTAEVLYAVRYEMAVKLSDVVRRRTELGTAGLASESALRKCADLMAAELGWSPGRREAEIEEALGIYRPFLPSCAVR